jgi:hypothetical protein
MNIDYDEDDNSLLSKVTSTINYIITNYHKFILLILAFFIIYFVDYISNINALIYSSQSIPVLSNLKTQILPLKLPKQSKKNRRKKHL